jgi:hypothetical protein
MGFFSRLFGSDKIIDAGVNGIDAMIFTDEEKSNAKMQFLKLYEPYKLAQRYLALIYSIPYALAWLVTFIASFFIDVALQIELLKGDAFYINIVILSFYFGGGAAEGIVGKFKK